MRMQSDELLINSSVDSKLCPQVYRQIRSTALNKSVQTASDLFYLGQPGWAFPLAHGALVFTRRVSSRDPWMESISVLHLVAYLRICCRAWSRCPSGDREGMVLKRVVVFGISSDVRPCEELRTRSTLTWQISLWLKASCQAGLCYRARTRA